MFASYCTRPRGCGRRATLSRPIVQRSTIATPPNRADDPITPYPAELREKPRMLANRRWLHAYFRVDGPCNLLSVDIDVHTKGVYFLFTNALRGSGPRRTALQKTVWHL